MLGKFVTMYMLSSSYIYCFAPNGLLCTQFHIVPMAWNLKYSCSFRRFTLVLFAGIEVFTWVCVLLIPVKAQTSDAIRDGYINDADMMPE